MPGTMHGLTPESALPGRTVPIPTSERHLVSAKPIKPPFPVGFMTVQFGMGCFWGAEKRFWETDGVYVTAAGYAGGFTPNPIYREVCSGMTGHAEVVLVVYEPEAVSLEALLRVFWESHDPTQGDRQGGDVGTQYRSCIYVDSQADAAIARESLRAYQEALTDSGIGAAITTEIAVGPTFYYAEEYHQQYLERNPQGYCGLAGTGVACR